MYWKTLVLAFGSLLFNINKTTAKWTWNFAISREFPCRIINPYLTTFLK